MTKFFDSPITQQKCEEARLVAARGQSLELGGAISFFGKTINSKCNLLGLQSNLSSEWTIYLSWSNSKKSIGARKNCGSDELIVKIFKNWPTHFN